MLESEDIEISSVTSFIKFGESARRLPRYDLLSKESLSELELSIVVINFCSEEVEEDDSLELED